MSSNLPRLKLILRLTISVAIIVWFLAIYFLFEIMKSLPEYKVLFQVLLSSMGVATYYIFKLARRDWSD